MSDLVMISILILLSGLNAFQLFYWSRQVHKLIDKLMSRSYHEYESAKMPVPRQAVSAGVEFNIEEDTDLKDLNNIMVGL